MLSFQFSRLGLLSLAFVLPLLTVSALSNQPTLASTRNKQVTFAPRKDQPRPKYTVGGGRRSEEKCPQDRLQNSANPQVKSVSRLLTPLVPGKELLPGQEREVQFTMNARPTLLVYIPSTRAKAIEVTLYVQENRREKGVYQTMSKLPPSPGIMRITLPPEAPALEVGRDYKWSVALACQTRRPAPSDPFTERLIRRIEPGAELVSKLKQTTGLGRAALYGEAGFWYEMVAELADLRQAKPEDGAISSNWLNLLQTAGFGELAEVPLRN